MNARINALIQRNPARTYRQAGITCIVAALATYGLMTAYGRTFPLVFVGLAIVLVAAEGIRRAGSALDRPGLRAATQTDAPPEPACQRCGDSGWIVPGKVPCPDH